MESFVEKAPMLTQPPQLASTNLLANLLAKADIRSIFTPSGGLGLQKSVAPFVLLAILPERFLGSFGMLIQDRMRFAIGANEALKKSINDVITDPRMGRAIASVPAAQVLQSVFSPEFRKQFQVENVLEVQPAPMLLSYALVDSHAFVKAGNEAVQNTLSRLMADANFDLTAPKALEKNEQLMAQFVGTYVLYTTLFDVSVSRDHFSFGARVRASKAKKEVLELLMAESRRRKLPAKSAQALASLFARVAKRIFK
jgi:hypothetical protein